MPDHYFQGVLYRPVRELLPGDRVDLEGDLYGDPEHDPAYQCEFQVVAGWEQETPDCVRVDFESGPSIGFPTHWSVKVDAEQTPEERSSYNA